MLRNKVNKMMKKPIFFSILRSYLVICVFILLTNIVLASIFFWYFYRSSTTAAHSQAQYITGQLDTQFEYAQQYMDYMVGNTYVTNYIRPSSTPGTRTLAARKLMGELMRLLPQRQFSKTIVYSMDNHSACVTGNRNYSDNMLDLLCSQYNLLPEDFQALCKASSLPDYYLFSDGRFWITRPLLNSVGKRSGLLIEEFEIQDFMAEVEQISNGNHLVLRDGDDDTLIYATDPDSMDSFSQNYHPVSYPTKLFGWHLTVGISKETLYSSFYQLIPTVSIELLLSAVAVVCAAFLMARRNYHPIQQLLSLFPDGIATESLDWEGLYAKAKTTIEERQKLEGAAASYQAGLTSQKIENYLMGRSGKNADIVPLIHSFLNTEEDAPVLMAVIQFNKSPHRDEFIQEDRELEYFLLLNVVNELIFDKYPGRLLSLENQFAILLPVSGDSLLADVEQQLQVTLDMFRTHFSHSTEIIMSDCIYDYAQVDTVYQSLADAVDYHHFWESNETSGKVMHLSDSREVPNSLNYGEYLAANRKLMNYLELGEYNMAYETLEQLYTTILPKDPRYLKMNIYRMYGIISMIILYVNVNAERPNADFLKEMDYQEKLYGVRSMEDLMQVSKMLFDSIITYKKQNELDSQPDWLSKVIHYINGNYADENLNVTAIAERYGLSVPHLSRTFKATMGKGVLEYIHTIRIQNAKLMLDEGMTIKAVATAVGYLDAKALTRIFKRYEGITAEQYKKMKQT